MQRIVYVLGAGFSAPLGLPVMSNFLFKSKDMFARNPEKYKDFREVFETINKIAIAKSYYSTDIFNIEDVLCLLEMNDYLKGQKFDEAFKKYIVEVIRYYTPDMALPNTEYVPSNWETGIFGGFEPMHAYGFFVSSILNLRATSHEPRAWSDLLFDRGPESDVSYDVLTFNYDRVLESVVDYINETFPASLKGEQRIEFSTAGAGTVLAKLHGCVDGEIVPPTWNKGTVTSVHKVWEAALNILSRATQIRFLGYSLPVADSYFKYLLKSAVLQHQHLQKIDIICKDGDGITERRFRDFITFNYIRFYSGDIADYLKTNMYMTKLRDNPMLRFNKLEEAHEMFMNGKSLTTWN